MTKCKNPNFHYLNLSRSVKIVVKQRYQLNLHVRGIIGDRASGHDANRDLQMTFAE